MRVQSDIYESAKLENLENIFVSMNEAKEVLRCSREVIVDLINTGVVIPSKRNGGKVLINKADLQILVIKITSPKYPHNFGDKKIYITKNFPVSRIEEIN